MMAQINNAAVRALHRALRPYDQGEEMDPYPEYTGRAWAEARLRAVTQVAQRFNMDPDALWGDLYATACRNETLSMIGRVGR